LQPQVGGFALQFRAQRAVAHQNYFEIRKFPMRARGRAKKHAVILVRRIHAGNHADPQDALATSQCRSRFRKSTRRQTIAHHHELTFRQTRLRQSIRRRA